MKTKNEFGLSVRLGNHRAIQACLFIVRVAVILILLGCTREPAGELDQALARSRQNQLNEALPLFEQAVAKNQNNPDAHAWLAETHRRLGRKDAAVNAARRAVALDPCHSFAYTVLADAYNPLYGWEAGNFDSTWTHLQTAIACDSTDGNAWVSIWSEAIRRGDRPMMARALRSAVHAGFLTKAALVYCRWMLRSLRNVRCW